MQLPPQDIVARSITLVDSTGTPRIHMQAERSDGTCCITLDSPVTGGIQIEAGPNRTAAIAISAPKQFGTISISQDGLSIRATDGKLGVLIGKHLDGKSDQITIFRDGQPIWHSPPAA